MPGPVRQTMEFFQTIKEESISVLLKGKELSQANSIKSDTETGYKYNNNKEHCRPISKTSIFM